MGNSAAAGIQSHQWIELAEAFQKIGRGLEGERWLKDCWKVGFFPPDQLPHYVDERKVDVEAFEDESPDIWDDVEFAPQEMVLQFERTQEYLRKGFWHGDIGVSCIDPSGKLTDLDRSVWRDQRYTVSWSESKLLRWKKSSGPTENIWQLDSKILHESIVRESTWNIEVRLSDVEKILQSLDNERRNAVRKRASKQNPNKGGRPPTYDWEKIRGYIREVLKNSDKATSDTAVASVVGKRLKDEGIDPPVSSALREAVSKVRES